MWLHASVLFLSCLVLGSQSQGQDQASLRRSNDHSGRCQYTFTVASPEESSCPGGSVGPEMEGVVSRLTLLEAMVSQLVGEGEGASGTGAEAGAKGLQEAYTQVMGEKNQLQQDKEQLSRQVQELQRRLNKLSLEAESLRQKPCHQTPGGAGGAMQPVNQRPDSGEYNSC